MGVHIRVLFIIFSSVCSAQIVPIPDTFFKAKLLCADATKCIVQNLGGSLWAFPC